jgi:hypothetical protein
MSAPRKAGRTAKKSRDRRWQTHVYLDEDDYKQLREVADRESRSVTMQIQYYVRVCLEREAAKP